MKFSIRDLLLVTVIVALAAGWGVDRRQWNIREKALIREKEAVERPYGLLRNFVELDGSKVDVVANDFGNSEIRISPPPDAKRWDGVGDDPFGEVPKHGAKQSAQDRR